MPREQPLAILDPLRRLINRQTGSALTDAQLLENFVAQRDEASFEVLVWRHGAMVLALCKRVLRDSHETEDAFQATFLVFARKAASIGRGEVVAAWLYKVAYRASLRLRAAAAKRPTPGELADSIPAPEPSDPDWSDLKPVLDDEIARLPEKYRAPFVLCYLEGRTNEEAAAQLGCPKGTVLSRLSRGRERLRARLARRGLTLTTTGLALTLSQNAASASVQATLVSPTVSAALPFAAGKAAPELVSAHVAALAEGVLKTMTLVKLKITAAILALAVLASAGGAGLAWGARDEGDSPANPTPVATANSAPDANTVPAAAQRERPAAAPAITGVVSDVAKDGKSFTLDLQPPGRGNEDGKAVVKLGEKVVVTYNGIGPNGATPAVGYTAQVWFEGDSKQVAMTVVFTGPESARRAGDIGGQVSAIAKDGKSITLELPLRGGRGRGGADSKQTEIRFDAKTMLIFSNVAKDEAKLTIGHAARVWWADDGKTAAKVQLTGTAGSPGRRDEKRPDATGKVARTDGKSIVVDLPAGRGEEPARARYAINDKTTVLFNNVGVDGAKIASDMQVQVWLAEGSKDTAAKAVFTGILPERWATVTGKVVAVAKDGNSFTVETPSAVRGEGPKRTEIKITAKTKLAFFGVGPGEAKIAEGMMAQVRLLDGSPDTASQVVFGKPGDRGRGRE